MGISFEHFLHWVRASVFLDPENYTKTHFVRVAEAPDFSIHKRAGQDASEGVEVPLLAHAATLQAQEPATGGVCHVYQCQAAAG